jgi:AAA lid domain/ATPase family associated with various cellular activities (AAA)
VAGYVGQTAARVDEVVSSALGGVLLVDEAYSLAREDDFGREAIDALVKRMEDHRDDLVVIVAGYPVEMEHLLDANPGLRSRFPRTIHFGDMTDDQLVDVFAAFCRRSRYEAGPDVLGAVADHLAALPRGRDFGNARTVRNLFEATLEGQAGRLVRDRAIDEASLVHLAASDVPPPPGPGRDRPAAPQGAAGRSST